MVNIQRLGAALAAFFISSAFASFGDPNPDEDPYNGLFDYAYGVAAQEVVTQVVSCIPHGQLSPSACAAAICDSFVDDATNQYRDKTPINDPNGSQITIGCTMKLYQYYPASDAWFYQRVVATSGNYYPQEAVGYQCPPDGQWEYGVSAMLGSANMCFSGTDLKYRDSCPNSTTDGAFILPAGTQTADKVCQPKSDGSVCAYSKKDDYYIADFEHDCYSLNGTPEYDPEGFSDPDPNQSCQQIGNGVSVCPEDPANVCNTAPADVGDSWTSCLSSCGYMDLGNGGSFVCLSQDTDSDGLPDYADPDKDGDGIPNSQDLDSDGDGIDDPQYPSEGAITVDNSGLEQRLDSANSKLSSIDSTLSEAANGIGSMNDKLGSILDETKKITSPEGITFDDVTISEGVTGFYEPSYENGWADVWASNQEAFNNSSTSQYIETWKVQVSGEYIYPQFCFNISSSMNYGCHQVEIDGRVMAFIRLLIIITALITARQITLGA